VLLSSVAVWSLSVDAISLVSVEQEIAIGKQADAQVREETPQLRDVETINYIRTIGRRLVRHASGAKYPYTFSVADDRTINAFALPGGPVWVHRGVLDAATTEAQLAGVMAHEVAHISRRHAAGQLTKATMTSWGLGLLGAVLGNDGGAAAARIAAGYLASGIFLKFGRDDEREADRVGLQMMTRAGWEARGMVELFEILRREQARDPGRVEAFFSTHPSPRDRIARLQQEVAKSRRGRRDSAEFRRMKARIAPPRRVAKPSAGRP
jgi:beta-barrel assembly-enhancing protease